MDTRSAAPRLLTGGGGAIVAVATAGYIAIIQQEGDDQFWDIFPWVTIMAIGTTLALSAALIPNRSVGRFAAAAAVVVLGLLGLVAIFSVGLGFLVAAGLAFIAAVMPTRTTTASRP
jgi:hypothetical protein